MRGAWDGWYSKIRPGDPPRTYGDDQTYVVGAEWLAPCSMVEDWGCGYGGFSKFRSEGLRSLDGSLTPFADEVVDLSTYRSEVPGVFMRHVLEHNFQWVSVLENALVSAAERMALVIFTPSMERTQVLKTNEAYGVAVPDIAFSEQSITAILDVSGARWSVEHFATATEYGEERVYLLEWESA